MPSKLSVSISQELDAAIERIGKEEQLDKDAVIRRLLESEVREHERERAFDCYENGEMSVGQLAEAADMSLREALMELRERGVNFSYSKESLQEDLTILEEFSSP